MLHLNCLLRMCIMKADLLTKEELHDGLRNT